MGNDQVALVVEGNLVGRVLEIDGQIALAGLQRQVAHLLIGLLLPHLALLVLCGKRVARTRLDHIACLDLLALLHRWRQIKACFCLTLGILRFDQHLIANHQELINVFLVYR